jgi:hypothetical protein
MCTKDREGLDRRHGLGDKALKKKRDWIRSGPVWRVDCEGLDKGNIRAPQMEVFMGESCDINTMVILWKL